MTHIPTGKQLGIHTGPYEHACKQVFIQVSMYIQFANRSIHKPVYNFNQQTRIDSPRHQPTST